MEDQGAGCRLLIFHEPLRPLSCRLRPAGRGGRRRTDRGTSPARLSDRGSSIGHGFPVRGSSQPIITRYGSRRLRGSSWRCSVFAAKPAVCSSVCRLSRGSAIHSRMTVLRIACLFILALLRRDDYRASDFASRASLRGCHLYRSPAGDL
jgi:hypothetical protein